MPETEPQPAHTPAPDPKLGSPTPLPDVAALAIIPTLPDLQPNPLYVAPAPALEMTNPANPYGPYLNWTTYGGAETEILDED